MRYTLAQLRQRIGQSSLVFAAAATLLRIGAQLLLLPAVLLYLAPHEQAIWWMFVALGNVANLADFGLGQAITRVYNFLWAGADDFEAEGLRPVIHQRQPNITGIAKLNDTVRHLYWWLSVAATILLAVAGTLYLLKTVNKSESPQNVWILWSLYLTAVGFNFATSYWMLACQGINRVREMQRAYVVSSLVFLGVVAVLLRAGFGLTAMVLGTVIRGIVLRQMGRTAFYKVIPRNQIATKPDYSVLRRLWPNARKFGVLSITGYWAANGLVLLSGYFFDSATTASVGVTNQAGNILINFAGLWLAVKWPEITVLRTQARLQEMSVLFARRLGLALATFVVTALVIAVAGNPILAWKHSHTRLIELPYLLLYFGYLLQQLIYVQFAQLVFTENVVPFCKISCITAIAMITLSLILTPRWGLWGLILAPLFAEILLSAWIVVRRGFAGQCLSLREFVRAASGARL